jgi:hypothetical protein
MMNPQTQQELMYSLIETPTGYWTPNITRHKTKEIFFDLEEKK